MADGAWKTLAADLVAHWEARKESDGRQGHDRGHFARGGVRLFDEIVKLRPEWRGDRHFNDRPHQGRDDEQLGRPAVLSAAPHRQAAQELEKRFKDADDPLEIVIVRDMWLTGFDAPPVNTLYVDKPMQGHGLMQAIARTNRIWRDKPGGLIVDYIGIGEELKKAIKQYTRDAGSEREPVDTSGRRCASCSTRLDVIRKEFFHGFDYAASKTRSARCPAGAGDGARAAGRPEPDEKGRNRGVRAFLDQVAKLTKAQALAGTLERGHGGARGDRVLPGRARVLIKLTRAGESRSRSRRKPRCASSWPRACWSKASTTSSARWARQARHLGAGRAVPRADPGHADQEPGRRVAGAPDRRPGEGTRPEERDAGQGVHQKLEEAIAKYQNRALTTVEVIEELIKLAKEINARSRPDDMSEEEFAFYQALCENESAVRKWATRCCARWRRN
jgi:type I restriction enzyme R subunit